MNKKLVIFSLFFVFLLSSLTNGFANLSVNGQDRSVTVFESQDITVEGFSDKNTADLFRNGIKLTSGSDITVSQDFLSNGSYQFAYNDSDEEVMVNLTVVNDGVSRSRTVGLVGILIVFVVLSGFVLMGSVFSRFSWFKFPLGWLFLLMLSGVLRITMYIVQIEYPQENGLFSILSTFYEFSIYAIWFTGFLLVLYLLILGINLMFPGKESKRKSRWLEFEKWGDK